MWWGGGGSLCGGGGVEEGYQVFRVKPGKTLEKRSGAVFRGSSLEGKGWGLLREGLLNIIGKVVAVEFTVKSNTWMEWRT